MTQRKFLFYYLGPRYIKSIKASLFSPLQKNVTLSRHLFLVILIRFKSTSSTKCSLAKTMFLIDNLEM
jgi:hypothetical protein